MTNTTPTPQVQQIESRLIALIQRELLSPGMTLDREDDLLSGDLLDSVAVLRLAALVAEEHEILIQPADFVIENFQTVALLAQYVLRATDQASR